MSAAGSGGSRPHSGRLPAARALADTTLEFFKTVLDGLAEEIANVGSDPTMYAAIADDAGGLQWYDGRLRFRDAKGAMVATDIRAADYGLFIGEASLRDSYLKAPYYTPVGYPAVCTGWARGAA